MRKDFITFRSITPAQRAQQLLRRGGIEAALQRTPGYLQERGCGYCLRLDPKHTARAAALLDSTGIVYSKLHRSGETAS